MLEDEVSQDSQRWRQRYYDSLHELENKERQWAELESLLRRSISRLTLLGDGQDVSLDRQLEKLRNIIREERDSGRIRRLVDAIMTTAEYLENHRDQGTAPEMELAAVLAPMLEVFPRHRLLDRKVKALRKKLAAGADGGDAGELVQKFTSLMRDAMSAAADNATEGSETGEQGGLLKRFMGRGQGRAAAQAPMLAEDDADKLAEAAGDAVGVVGGVLLRFLNKIKVPSEFQSELRLLKQWAAAASRQAEYRALANDIARMIAELEAGGLDQEAAEDSDLTPREVLMRLLESISLPAELEDEVENIKNRLAQEEGSRDLTPALKSIATLVSEMRTRAQQERREIEDFLRQLTERLHDLDQHLEGANAARAESFESSMKLQDAVNAQVGDIENAVQSATNLEPLKQAVQSRVEAIRRHMEQHRQAEDQRNRQSEEQIQALTSRLHSLESETENLRETVQDARRRALVDPLTGLNNRMAYEERMAQEYARWKRYGAPLSVVVWDLDHFKKINDGFGHKAGDKVLKVVGQLFAKTLRATDFTARYGGEEFISILTETNLDMALNVAEKFRAGVEKCGFHFRGETVPVTISCGISQFREEDSPERVFERADEALYQAKRNGRNQCYVLDGEGGAA